MPGSTANDQYISTFPISREIPILLMYLPEDASRARQYRKCPIHNYFSLKYFSVLMDSLQTDSTVPAFLYHSRVDVDGRWLLVVVSFEKLCRRYSMRTIFQEMRQIPINGIRNTYLR